MKTVRRSNCPLSCALEIFGDRWSLLIIRDIALHDKCTFKSFMESEERISSNILSNRLKTLSDYQLIEKKPHTSNKVSNHYQLTAQGRALIPVLESIADWGLKHLSNTTH